MPSTSNSTTGSSKKACSCGLCIEVCAEATADTIVEELANSWDMLKDTSDYDQLLYFHDLAFLPLPVQDSTRQHKMVKAGFAQVARYIAMVLHNNQLPTVHNVLNNFEKNPDWPPNTKQYLQKGGKVEYVLDCILSKVESQNEDQEKGEAWQTFEEDIKDLPVCPENDKNYKLLRSVLFSEKYGATCTPEGPNYPPGYWEMRAMSAEEKDDLDTFRKLQETMSKDYGSIEKANEELRKVFETDTDEAS